MEAVTTAHPYVDHLTAAACGQGPVTVAVAHACDHYALEAALDTARGRTGARGQGGGTLT